MRKNPVIPFAIIAVLGIVAMIIISAAGINQREAIENEEEGGGGKTGRNSGRKSRRTLSESMCKLSWW